MKLFTVDEANALLPDIRLKLECIKGLYEKMAIFRQSAKAAAVAATEGGGGGMEGGTIYVKSLYEIGRLTTEINDAGVQLKDYTRGLIDFPSMREGRVVLLCWQLGEAEELVWWHELEGGFVGRQPL